MKHNTFTKLVTLALAVVLALSLAACGSKTDDNSGDATAATIKIGVPNDTTNEARALLLLQENGIIKLKDGAVIGEPNDTTNEARALLLLQDMGLITLKEGAGLTATRLDIVKNPRKVKIEEIEAAQLGRSLPDLDLAVINGNYAILAGLKVKDALRAESPDSLAATTYANIVAIRQGDENRPELQALLKALRSPEVQEYMLKTYDGAVLPAK